MMGAAIVPKSSIRPASHAARWRRNQWSAKFHGLTESRVPRAARDRIIDAAMALDEKSFTRAAAERTRNSGLGC